MNINVVFHKIRQSADKPFHLVYVRSAGKSIGSVGSGDFIFDGYIDTNEDIIKLRTAETFITRTLKISHILSFNHTPITR